jgi:hypothetical protein
MEPTTITLNVFTMLPLLIVILLGYGVGKIFSPGLSEEERERHFTWCCMTALLVCCSLCIIIAITTEMTLPF